jgi:protein TonB
MPDKMRGSESTAAATERRATQRVRASSLIYVELDNGNGGIVTGISEGGLALTAAGVLQGKEIGDELPKMQIQLPEIEGASEANGRIVWKSKSGKEAGVRFVDLGEEDRDRIRRWISAQTRKNSFEQDQPELPKMQVPTAKAPKKRGSRFSFADVASSRVGAEEAHAGDFLEGAEEAEAPHSPSMMKSHTFVDGSNAVASAFESIAFTEEPRTEVSSDRGETRTLPPTKEAHQERPRLSLPERRSYSRRPILLFTQAVLADDNGGLAFNLGEGGLALTAAAALRDSHFTQMRIRFPDSEDWIETKGRLAWISDSGKEAGIEFIGLAENVRARIKEWVSLGDPADDSRGEESGLPGKKNLPSALPSFAESESPVSVPRESTAALEERLNTPVVPRSGMMGVFAKASVRGRVAKIKPPEPARPPRHAVQPQGSAGQKALVAAAFILLGLGWTLVQRDYRNEAGGLVAQSVPKAAIPSESQEKTLVAPKTPTADASIRQSEDITPPADTMKPLAENIGRGTDSAVKQGLQNQNEDGLRHAPAVNSQPGSAGRVERKTPPPRELRPEPTPSVSPAPVRPQENRTTENKFVENKPVVNKPVQVAAALPAPQKELNTAPPSLSATPIQPEAAPTFGKEKVAPPPPPKQPEVPVTRTPVVTVSFDPYPSIRMPEKENSKKSRQGKTLQMGHLVLRIDPVYPEQAKQQGVEGTVNLHVVVGREGAVQSLTPLSGPPLLVPAAMNAVHQWRFSPTILGGQAMETEEDIAVLFRLSSNVLSKN